MKKSFLKKISNSLILALLCALVFLPTVTVSQTKAGFIYVSPIGDAGWTYQHDTGRKEMEQSLGDKVVTSFVENVAEGPDSERVIREMAQGDIDVIFATSFGYMNPMAKVSPRFKDKVFLHATGYKKGRNFGIYNARFYEGRYVNGIVAGAMTKSNILGYVAAFPIPEVLQGINAFAMGAKSVNPDIEVRVIWVNSWFDPAKERDAATTLISQGADIVTHHTDSTAVVQAAEEKGKYAFGYHSDMSKFGPNSHLSATIHEWGKFYTNVMNEIIAGKWNGTDVWGGFKDGMIRIAPIHKDVPPDVRRKVNILVTKMKNGLFHPFTGEIRDQDGKVRLEKGKVMDDRTLNSINYYVEGVASRLP